jgi:RHS repeat-associated protein
MQMPGRKFSSLASGYRYGFNGKELDNEVVQYDYGFRIYDPRLVRFKSVDPLTQSYPWNSTYAYAEGDVIRCIDVDGLEKFPYKHPNKYPVLGKVDRDNTLAGSDRSTYTISAEDGSYKVSSITVYEQWKDALGLVHHFNNYYLVQDKALVNESNVSTGAGTTILTKGTNWHLYMSDKQGSSTQFQVSMAGVDALGVGLAGAITAAAAAPAIPFLAKGTWGLWVGAHSVPEFIPYFAGLGGMSAAGLATGGGARSNSSASLTTAETESLLMQDVYSKSATLSRNGQSPATVVSGSLNGQMGSATSGSAPGVIAPQLQGSVNSLGGVGARTNGNTVGCCGEFRLGNNLLLENPSASPAQIQFSPAIRPRTNQVVLPCENCQTIFPQLKR